jgi:hypothetical protein
MSRTTTLNIALDVPTKDALFTGDIAIREQVNLAITNYGSASAADLIAAIVCNGTLVALLQGLTQEVGVMSGVLDLNTVEIVAALGDIPANGARKMSFVIWDTTYENCLCNSWIWVRQNPYDPSMEAPIPVDPIGGVLYAPIAKGVDGGNGHQHMNGQGGDLSPYFILRVPPGANFRVAADGLNFEFFDPVLLTWDCWGPYNGAWSKL